MNPRKLLEANLDLIDEICSSICRSKGCFGADADDFTAQVHLELVQGDYARLRKFRGRSSLKSFLRAVLLNLFRDYRNHKWGRWRPSAEARRQGAVGLLLDELLHRDGYSFDEAVEILRTRFDVATALDELEKIAGKLPVRVHRRFEDDDQLAEIPIDGAVEQRVFDRETAATARRARSVLHQALSALPAEDRLILKMRFDEGITVTRIATTLRIRRRQLYSRIERCLKDLRTTLQHEGLGIEDVRDILGWDSPDELLGSGNSRLVSVSTEGATVS